MALCDKCKKWFAHLSDIAPFDHCHHDEEDKAVDCKQITGGNDGCEWCREHMTLIDETNFGIKNFVTGNYCPNCGRKL